MSDSTISEVLARKISSADHVIWGNSLVIAAYYDIERDSYAICIFSISGKQLSLIKSDDMDDAVIAVRHPDVVAEVNRILAERKNAEEVKGE